MKKSRHTAEKIVAKLLQAEVELARGRSIPQAASILGITDTPFALIGKGSRVSPTPG